MLEDNLSQQQPNKKTAKCRNFLAQVVNGEIRQFLNDNKAVHTSCQPTMSRETLAAIGGLPEKVRERLEEIRERSVSTLVGI